MPPCDYLANARITQTSSGRLKIKAPLKDDDIDRCFHCTDDTGLLIVESICRSVTPLYLVATVGFSHLLLASI